MQNSEVRKSRILQQAAEAAGLKAEVLSLIPTKREDYFGAIKVSETSGSTPTEPQGVH